MRVIRGSDFRYSKQCLINGVPLNLTGASITFTVKESKDGDVVFQRKNTAAGGSDAQIEIVSATDGLVLIKGDRANTTSMERQVNFCDLYIAKSTSDYICMYEEFIVGKSALQGTETVIGDSDSASKFLRYLATDGSTLTDKAGKGWTTEPTLAFNSTNIEITSADAEFTLGQTFVELSNKNISFDANGSGTSTTGLIIIKPITADYPFTINIYVYS
jgi:hypothetical protein